MSVVDNFIPISRAVKASIVDTYEDKGKVEATYFHWAARVFKDLNRKYLKLGKRSVLLPVSSNTHTATLPCDFESEVFVGTIINGERVPLSLNYRLSDSKNIEEPDCVDKCPKCNQDKAICEDLAVTEEITLITINGTAYEQSIIKKLYPNGDYYLESKIPVYNTETEAVVWRPLTKIWLHCRLVAQRFTPAIMQQAATRVVLTWGDIKSFPIPD